MGGKVPWHRTSHATVELHLILKSTEWTNFCHTIIWFCVLWFLGAPNTHIIYLFFCHRCTRQPSSRNMQIKQDWVWMYHQGRFQLWNSKVDGCLMMSHLITAELRQRIPLSHKLSITESIFTFIVPNKTSHREHQAKPKEPAVLAGSHVSLGRNGERPKKAG